MRLPWKYILLSLAIGLLLGGAAGLFAGRGFAGRWTKKSPEMFLRHLDHELKLTEPQRAQIRSILGTNRAKMGAYEDGVRKTTRSEIRGELTSDQQTKFDAMVARHDAERKKREGS